MDVEPSGSEDTRTELSTSLKACDVCRARKIKCDRKLPSCSSCLTAHIPCKNSVKPKEKKQRILISAGYENEIREVNERLSNLEKSINRMVSTQQPVSTTSEGTRPVCLNGPSKRLYEDNSRTFEGASSFTAHSKQVSAAFGGSTIDHDPRCSPIQSTIANPSILDTESREVDICQSLPPSVLILKMLKLAKLNTKKYFPGLSDINITSLSEMCQKLYFPSEELSPAYATVAVCGLWKLVSNFGEHDLPLLGCGKLDVLNAAAVCAQNLDQAALSAPLILEHTYIQIQSLMLLSAFLLETGRPSLARTFASACMRLCQDMGYHCLQSLDPQSETQKKIIIFWVVFAIDRGLSLNFGKSPTLQDYDITTSRPTLDGPPQNSSEYGLFLCAVGAELAYLQGDTYLQLFSGRAMTESRLILAQRVPGLAERTNQLRCRLSSFEIRDHTIVADMIQSYDLVLQSHLALLYRAIPSSRGDSPLHFSDECVEASRAAMQGHNKAWRQYRIRTDTAWRTAINWSYLFSPFISFIVLFGTVITMKSTADLDLMKDSIETLDAASEHSPGIAKLYNACNMFYNLAKLYNACNMFYNLAKIYIAHNLQDETSLSGSNYQASFSEPFDPRAFLHEDLNLTLSDWDLGLGGDDAREMSSFLSGSFPLWPGTC